MGRCGGSRAAARLRPTAWVALFAFVLGLCGMLPSTPALAGSAPVTAELHMALAHSSMPGSTIEAARVPESQSMAEKGGSGHSMAGDACSCCFGPGGISECHAVLATADASPPNGAATQAVGAPFHDAGSYAPVSSFEGPSAPSLGELSLLRI